MTDTLIKRTAENVRFDIDCSSMFMPGETISAVLGVATDQVTTPPLVFGDPAVNSSAIKYKSGLAPARTVVQVLISGGVIPGGVESALYTLRVDVETTINPRVQAVVTLQLTDAA